MTDEERIRRAIDDDCYVGDVAPILAAEVRRLRDIIDRSRAILVKPITFFDIPTVLACDGRCDKAWGINNRPKIQLSDEADDYAYLSDGELPEAPREPGTWEGADTKPTDYSDPKRQNRWCARECERSELVEIGEIKLSDFSARLPNYFSRRGGDGATNAAQQDTGR